MTKKMLILGLALAALTGLADPPKGYPHVRINLWPEGKTPVAGTNYWPKIKVDETAWIDAYLPTCRVNEASMLIAPGGGYLWWCWGSEGPQMMDYLLAHGMTAIQLKYRVPRLLGTNYYAHVWADQQRAVRLVRAHAKEWGLDPEKIGINGYSAGGHLALLAAFSSETPAYAPIDEIDKVPCHVNWSIPVYPAYILSDEDEDNPGKLQGNDLSLTFLPSLRFDRKTPPMCFFHGDSDSYSPMGSVRLYHKLRLMKIPAEIHVFANRGHCYHQYDSQGESCAQYRDTAMGWLNSMGYSLEVPRICATNDFVKSFRAGVRGFVLKVETGDLKTLTAERKDLPLCKALGKAIGDPWWIVRRREFCVRVVPDKPIETDEEYAWFNRIMTLSIQCGDRKAALDDCTVMRTPDPELPTANTADEYFALKAKGAKAVISSDPVALRKAVYERVEAACRAQMGL